MRHVKGSAYTLCTPIESVWLPCVVGGQCDMLDGGHKEVAVSNPRPQGAHPAHLAT